MLLTQGWVLKSADRWKSQVVKTTLEIAFKSLPWRSSKAKDSLLSFRTGVPLGTLLNLSAPWCPWL